MAYIEASELYPHIGWREERSSSISISLLDEDILNKMGTSNKGRSAVKERSEGQTKEYDPVEERWR